jgi:hypothetical protein
VHILLRDRVGLQREGLLLAGSPERLRVMMPGKADAEEFRLYEGEWMGESGGVVEIAALAPVPSQWQEWVEEAQSVQPGLSV